jgi:hypothetical protein
MKFDILYQIGIHIKMIMQNDEAMNIRRTRSLSHEFGKASHRLTFLAYDYLTFRITH